MTSIKTKQGDVIANKLECAWLTKYLRPTQVILDRGREFMAEVIPPLHDKYNVKSKPITTRNLQANAILERAHQKIGNIMQWNWLQQKQQQAIFNILWEKGTKNKADYFTTHRPPNQHRIRRYVYLLKGT